MNAKIEGAKQSVSSWKAPLVNRLALDAYASAVGCGVKLQSVAVVLIHVSHVPLHQRFYRLDCQIARPV